METIKFFILLFLSLHFFSASGFGHHGTGAFTAEKSFFYGMPDIRNRTLNSEFPKFNHSNHSIVLDLNKLGIIKSFLNGNPQKTMAEKIRIRTWISGSLFAASHATGYLLASSDSPPNTALLAVHKLTSAANLVMLDVTLFQKNKVTRLTTGEKIAAVIMNVAFVTTIGTGGRLSMKKPSPNSVQTIHQIAPYVTTISAGALLYLLNKN